MKESWSSQKWNLKRLSDHDTHKQNLDILEMKINVQQRTEKFDKEEEIFFTDTQKCRIGAQEKLRER